ncbi:hypothetical protein [Mesonia sp. K4-1]|uniref:hypothetical protein n=1 Tax=Mesonia sp. K4-1 TaxID=2602760 RepID=UPI0011CAA738|nr:hypothetical protein [Mesonia sp. K4-1]TXK73151.1 hypothetical protein FT986_14225 [Mesonia sp. K4-1]
MNPLLLFLLTPILSIIFVSNIINNYATQPFTNELTHRTKKIDLNEPNRLKDSGYVVINLKRIHFSVKKDNNLN